MDQELARVSHPDSVNSPPSGNLDASAIVFPNPATDNVSFTITSEYNTEAVINIYLSSGSQLIHTSRVTLNKGENNITLPLEGSIIPGIYIYSIKLKNPENRKLQGKFIKVD
jgi:hypothetical protein